MATKSTSTIDDLMEQARGMVAINPMIEPQLEEFWKAQDTILEEVEAFSKSWFKRRHEAAETALKAVREANGNASDPAVAMQTMVEWQQGSFQRLADDMRQWFELCSRCAGRMTEAEVAAGKESADNIAEQAKSGAKVQ